MFRHFLQLILKIHPNTYSIYSLDKKDTTEHTNNIFCKCCVVPLASSITFNEQLLSSMASHTGLFLLGSGQTWLRIKFAFGVQCVQFYWTNRSLGQRTYVSKSIFISYFAGFHSISCTMFQWLAGWVSSKLWNSNQEQHWGKLCTCRPYILSCYSPFCVFSTDWVFAHQQIIIHIKTYQKSKKNFYDLMFAKFYFPRAECSLKYFLRAEGSLKNVLLF